MSRLTEALTSRRACGGLKPRLEELERDAMRLLAAAAPAPVTPPPVHPRRPVPGRRRRPW
jgi:hypothetical protein